MATQERAMGEAALKEPSMEEILASIRRIVTQGEGNMQNGNGAAPVLTKANKEAVPPAIPPVSKSAGDRNSFARLAQEVTGGMNRAAPPPVAGAQPRREAFPSVGANARNAHAQPRKPETPPRPAGPATAKLAAVAAQAERKAAAAPARSEWRMPRAVRAGSASDRDVEAFRGALVSSAAEEAVSDSLRSLKRSAVSDLDARVEQHLRPMLREWLDNNLPRLVEKLVRAEIERLAKKA
jgi:cell pole-organizing protein PopZ